MKSKLFYYHVRKGWKNLEPAKELDSEKSFITVFFSPMYVDKPEVFKELKSFFPNSIIMGCSTSGEIAQDHVRDRSLTCSITKLEDSSFKAHLEENVIASDSKNHGINISENLKGDNLKGIFVLSDGLQVNGSELAAGLSENINEKETVISGGLAGDGNDFNSTYTLYEDKLYQKSIVCLGLYGDSISVSSGSQGGWDKFGPKRTITKSEGNILFEIDNQPALDLYKEYLGDKASELPGSGLFFPLELSFQENDKKLVRTILAIDEEKKSMTFAGDVPTGSYAQLMKANFDRVIDGATQAAQYANEISDQDEESLTLAVSCVGRRLVLGAKSDDEIEAINEASGGGKVIGFYSYGEIAPIEHGTCCELHNQTMTLMRISEKKAS
jgi:hypothetical protein